MLIIWSIIITLVLVLIWRSRRTYLDAQEIAPGIWLGNWKASTDSCFLRRAGIKRILCINTNPKTGADRALYAKLGIEHMYIRARDASDEQLHLKFNKCYQFMKGCNEPILVHCTAGVSRSATIMAVYLIRSRNMLPDEAIQWIKSKRKIANPNSGFREQISNYGPMNQQSGKPDRTRVD